MERGIQNRRGRVLINPPQQQTILSTDLKVLAYTDSWFKTNDRVYINIAEYNTKKEKSQTQIFI